MIKVVNGNLEITVEDMAKAAVVEWHNHCKKLVDEFGKLTSDQVFIVCSAISIYLITTNKGDRMLYEFYWNDFGPKGTLVAYERVSCAVNGGDGE